jgi:L,D-transpeptidase-like protein
MRFRQAILGLGPRGAGALLLAFCALSLQAPTARASLLVSVDKSTQQMTVSVDGMPRYRWTVSTGRAGYGTPNGTYRPQRLARTWFSKKYYNSPMPHSIFFYGGYAIHGSYEINRLGGPASHGCIRLHPANATTLFALVQQEGMASTTIRVSGENPARRRRVLSSPESDAEAPPPQYQQPYAPSVRPAPYDAPAYERQPRGWFGDPYRW